jgi:hypothetical protein
MSDQIYLHRTCRACKGGLVEFLNLGNHRLNAFPRYVWEIGQIQRVPLILTVCTECGLVQLDRTVPADWMYRTYWYRSGVNETMVTELQEIVFHAGELMGIASGMRVLDIGANDGTLLKAYRDIWAARCPYRVAIEPALNLHERLAPNCDELIPDYFPSRALTPGPDHAFDIITAIACSYDVEDPVGFFQALHDSLAEHGLAIIQFQDFEHQLYAAAFDTICHEHLEYYSLWSLTHIFAQAGLSIQRVVHTPINGGSLRVFLRRREDHVPAEPSVGLQLVREAQAHLDTPTIRNGDLSAFHQFKGRVDQAKVQIASAIESALEQGCIIDVYGASTKGNVLLQVLDIGADTVRQAIDRSPEKWGFHTITGIPIVDESRAREEPAHLWLCPIWQFKDFMLERERWYLEQGGTILFPLPHTEVRKLDWKLRPEGA